MKRARNNEKEVEPWSDKRQKTDNDRQNVGQNSRQIGFGQNNRQIGFGHLMQQNQNQSDFSSDVLPSNLNVW
jgi:hypothetical protein